MSIKAGQILHDIHGFVIDRIQTGGVNSLNIPQEKIYELGNFQTVATIRDIPDLSFSLESLDVSSEIEAVLTGVDPTTTTSGEGFAFTDHIPVDVISPFKAGTGLYNIVKGLVVPSLALESATYRFGVRQNATQTFALKGDGVYYVPGTPMQQKYTLVSGTNHVYTLSQTALVFSDSGTNVHILSACVRNPSTHTYKRLFHTTDWTDTTTTITVLADQTLNGYTELHVTYGTATAGTYSQSVHQSTTVKPAAVRAKDIDVYVSDGAATPTYSRWTGVQNFEVVWKVTLDNDEEFGNSHYVASDYDVPDVSGSVTLKPADPADLFAKLAQIANVSTSAVVGPFSSIPLGVSLHVNDPDTGTRLKTIEIPDARFTIPAFSGRVQQKSTVQLPYQSDSGVMTVYQGAGLHG